jgi:aminomethyltransferase
MAAGEEFGMLACGLGSRDTLRTEMGYPLHGQDISLDVTPNEARLGWAVGWGKERFWGREVLVAEKAAGPKRVLRGLVAVGRGIPRPGMRVTLTADVALGQVTSGTFSPTLRKGVGLALVAAMVNPEAEVGVDVRGRREIFQLTKPPFVKPSVREA